MSLRAGSALSWLALGATTMLAAVRAVVEANELPGPDVFGEGPSRWLLLTLAYGFVGFGSWTSLRHGAAWTLRSRVVLLAAQSLAGVVDEALLYVVAVQLPFVFPWRLARGWLVAQIALGLSSYAWVLESSGAIDTLALPRWLAYLLLGGLEAGWQMFAFFVGRIAQVADARRDELERMQAFVRERSRMEERLVIARELHDAVGHHLAALSVNLDLATRLVGEGPGAAALRDAEALSRSLLREVRRVVGRMRDDSPTMGLAAELEELSARTIGIELRTTLETEPVSPHARAIARCVREALTNASRHGRARVLEVSVVREGVVVVVSIRDDGLGATRVVEGDGLRGMRERVEELGGSLSLTGGVGFPIVLRLPEVSE